MLNKAQKRIAELEKAAKFRDMKIETLEQQMREMQAIAYSFGGVVLH